MLNRDLGGVGCGEKAFSFGKSHGVGEAPLPASREKGSPLRARFSVPTRWRVPWPWSGGCRLFAAGRSRPGGGARVAAGGPRSLSGELEAWAAPGSPGWEAGGGERGAHGWALTAERSRGARPGSSEMKGHGHGRGREVQARGREACGGASARGARGAGQVGGRGRPFPAAGASGAAAAETPRTGAATALRRGLRPASPVGQEPAGPRGTFPAPRGLQRGGGKEGGGRRGAGRGTGR